MKEESRIRETSLNENIKEQEVSRGKVRKGFSGWLLVVMTMADLALLIAAVLCVHHLFIKTASETEQALHVQTERVSDTAYGSAQMRDSKTGIGKSGKREAGITETKAQSEGNTEPQTEENAGLTERENADRKQRQQKEICEKLYENHRELLILVNKDTALVSGYQQPLKLLKNKRVKVAQVMYQDLKTMLTDAENAGGYNYQLVSGYRAAPYQQSLVDRDVRSYIEAGKTPEEALRLTYQQVMPAGYSEHETGLALDITARGNDKLDESQAEEEGIQWLHKNCWRYGFILRYPKEKEAVTQISYEPWHFLRSVVPYFLLTELLFL
jgi:zinc D-Ala-D-Ala carboxypeptidase